MVNQFGCRPVMLIGGLLASSGMILASFTTNIIELYLTAGVLTGESPRSWGGTHRLTWGRAKTMLYLPLALPHLPSGLPSPIRTCSQKASSPERCTCGRCICWI